MKALSDWIFFLTEELSRIFKTPIGRNYTFAMSGSDPIRLTNFAMAATPSRRPSSMLMSRTWAPFSTCNFATFNASLKQTHSFYDGRWSSYDEDYPFTKKTLIWLTSKCTWQILLKLFFSICFRDLKVYTLDQLSHRINTSQSIFWLAKKALCFHLGLYVCMFESVYLLVR